MSGPNKFGKAQSEFKGIIVEDIFNNLVFDEVVFSISKRVTIQPQTTAKLYILFDPTAYAGNFVVILPIVFKAFQAGPVEINLYVNPTLSANGTEILSANRDFTSSKTAMGKWYLSPTITDVGTKLPPEFEIFSNGTPAVADIGGETSERQVSNLDFFSKYLIELCNTDSVNARGVVASTWFEV